MTTVTLYVRRGKILGFSANNHAGEGDEVGVLSMEDLLSIDEDTMAFEQSEAYVRIRLPEDIVSHETELLFRSMLVGLNAIEGAYENYIKIETQGV